MGLADPEDEAKSTSQKREPHPYLSAGILSRLVYTWMSPFMELGSRKVLADEDLPELMPIDRAGDLMDGLRAAQEEVRKEEEAKITAAGASAPPNARPRVHLLRMLWKQFGWHYLQIQMVLVIYSGMKIVQPLMLVQLVDFLADENEASWHGYLYAIAMGMGAIGQALCHHSFFFHAARVGIDVRIALNALIYEKALTLRTAHMMRTTTGQVVTLVSNDSSRAEDAAIYMPYLWVAPMELAIVLGLLYVQVGVAAFAGVATFLLLTPMQLSFSRLQAKYRHYTIKRTDLRTRTINEILVGADVMKALGWEDSLESKVSQIRHEEFSSISKAAKLKSINQAVFFFSLAVASLVTFGTMWLRGTTFTPSNVFGAIAFFNLIKLPTTNFIPIAVEKASECKIAFGRITRFLEMDQEVEADHAKFQKQFDQVKQWNERIAKEDAAQPGGDKPGTIHLDQASFVWEMTEEMSKEAQAAEASPEASVQDSSAASAHGPSPSPSPAPLPSPSNGGAVAPANVTVDVAADDEAAAIKRSSDKRQGLRKLDMHIPAGKLVGVIGSIGSYKSSLLAALLGEMTQINGGAAVHGRLSYASQSPWLMAASVRDNIVFGRPYDHARYLRTLRACQLVTDIQNMPQKDHTFLGEKGVNLSGGQRARISVARAVYGDSDVYLLDDPLAALDAVVARKLFEQTLSDEKGMLAGRTRVLVTHQTHLLTSAHIVLLEHGQIRAQGSFDELVAQGFLSESQRHAQADNDSGGVSDEMQRKQARQAAREVRRTKRRETLALQRASSVVSLPNGQVTTSNAANAATNSIVLAETSSVGELDARVFLRLFEAGGGSGLFVGLVLLMAAGQAAMIVADKWLANWSSKSAEDQKDGEQAYVYLILVLGTAFLGVTRARCFFAFILRAASVLHGKMFSSVIYSPLSWFQANPSGRVLNRFAKDQSIVDEMLPWTMFDFCQCACLVIGCIVAVGMSAPYILLILIPLIPLFVWVRRRYLNTSRELKRLDATSRSPVYAHFSGTLSGLMVIRAFHCQQQFVNTFIQHMDANTRAFMTWQLSSRWFGVRLDTLAASLVAALSLLLVGTRGQISPSTAAFALSYSLQLTSLFQWAVRQSAEVETMMTSVERIVEYGALPAEGALINPDYRPPEGWPSQGRIQFQDFKMRYRPNLDLVLKGVDLAVKPQEKVGVCGRTGAGKSSLFQALLRLVERDPSGGVILVDGGDTSRLGLRDLRRGLSIIPQTPVLYSGTVRYNLDPFGACGDDQLWAALDAVQLKDTVQGMRGGLDAEVAEYGSNLSLGEAQLVCVARALLKPSKILLLDEATANVDAKTDELIQTVIRQQFQSRTILTIAHRLNTIGDYDKVVVMAAGKVAEAGAPAELMARKPANLANDPNATSGLFAAMRASH